MSSNIEVKLDVLNQKASPALYAASLADRPAASFTGRLFIDSDNPSTGLYRDTGSSWIQIADAGAGTTGTLQQVTTNGNTSNVGISVTANGIGIGTTIPATNRLDIHSASGLQATFNGTGTTNSAIQLQLAGVGKWNVTNKYNSSANDFAITDVLNTLDRLTIKNTGQTFIGSSTTSSGLLVVNSATSDNHFVALGANAPSYRLRNAGTGATLDAGLGISTAINNFIQGSASGNFCLFNSSTTASPILFGIYDSGAGNTVEAARISAARNLLVGTVTDSGQKLIVNGNALINTLSIGLGAGSIATNSAIGYQSLNKNTTGNNNTGIGYQSLFNNLTGSANTGLGYQSLVNNINNYNTAIGVLSLYSNTSGSTNTATGYNSLYSNVDGYSNSALGANSLFSNVSGLYNVGLGYNSLYLSTGDNNVAIGAFAFNGNITGYQNTIVGYSSGIGMTSGINNTLLGANINIGNVNNNIALSTGDGTVRLQFDGSGALNLIGLATNIAVAAPSTHKISIKIGGVQYYLLASNV